MVISAKNEINVREDNPDDDKMWSQKWSRGFLKKLTAQRALDETAYIFILTSGVLYFKINVDVLHQ